MKGEKIAEMPSVREIEITAHAQKMFLDVLVKELKRTGRSNRDLWANGNPKEAIDKELVADVKKTCFHLAELYYDS